MKNKIGEAESVRVVVESLDTHPACEHGPAILFHRKNNNDDADGGDRFYACSAYRDQSECPLFVRCDGSTQISATQRAAMLNDIAEKSTKLANEQSSRLKMVWLKTKGSLDKVECKIHFLWSILFQVLKQKPDERIFCHSCHVFLAANNDDSAKNKCDIKWHYDHVVQRGISNHQIDCPTTFLRSLSNDKREAQYFFNETSLSCFVQILQQLQIT